MNKKIYFNDKFIGFTPDGAQFSDNQSFEIYKSIDAEALREITASFTDENNKKNILIIGQDFERSFSLLKDHFHYIEAAGGFIEKDDKFLFIRRHNRWDLPKGKLEKKEGIEEAAIRECEEECGINQLTIKSKLSPTYHVYPHKKGFALKQTFWFKMQTGFTGDLVPQLEEDITEVRWFDEKTIRFQVLADTYYTISDVVNEALGATG